MSGTCLLTLFSLLLRQCWLGQGPVVDQKAADLQQPPAVHSDMLAAAKLGAERSPGTLNDRTVLVRKGGSWKGVAWALE